MADKDLEAVLKAAKRVSRTIGPWCPCPKCGAEPDRQEVRNYDPIWHDGDVYCLECGAFVRAWDAG